MGQRVSREKLQALRDKFAGVATPPEPSVRQPDPSSTPAWLLDMMEGASEREAERLAREREMESRRRAKQARQEAEELARRERYRRTLEAEQQQLKRLRATPEHQALLKNEADAKAAFERERRAKMRPSDYYPSPSPYILVDV